MEKPRIGIYVCWCGTNIAKMVDVETIAREMSELPNVVVSKDYKYMCSDPGQDLIIKDIKKHNLNRIVVSACSPRIHEMTFRKALIKAGLNPYMVQMANIREHNSWVHTDRGEATVKAKALINAAVSRINHHVHLTERTVDVDPSTLIIGGGIAGLSAALEIADSGKQIYLVEKSDKLGGNTANIDLTYPYLDSAKQMLDPIIEDVKNHKHIKLFLETEIDEINGYIGNFETDIKLKDGAEENLTFGNIISAIGLKPMDPTPIENYGYGKFPDVITSAEFEEMLISGDIAKKDGSIPKNISIIHCVGSRNKEYNEYCSRTCCSIALKYANQLRSAFPKANIYELYADMRTMSNGCEELYSDTSRKKIMFMMFDQQNDLPIIKEANEKDDFDMFIEMTEQKLNKRIKIPADMVILMVSMKARDTVVKVGHSIGISLCGNQFFIEKHPKLDPVATTTQGVFVTGGCQGPKNIPDSIAQARAAAARILGTIAIGTAQVAATTAHVDPTLCCACHLCIPICPYTAISFDYENNVSSVNDALCQGCGTCIALCRPKALNIHGCTHKQVTAELTSLILSD